MIMHSPLHPGLIVKSVLIDGTGLNVTDAAENRGLRARPCHAY